MITECEWGCECESVPNRGFDTVLERVDFDRLVQGKIDRARRYIELQDRLGEQFETD